MSRIRVCLVEGHPLAARYVSQLVTHDPEFGLVEEQDLGKRGGTSRAVFLVDPSAGTPDLAKLLRLIRVRHPTSKVILLGPALEPPDLLRSLYLGIEGYVSFSDVPGKLASAIRAVSEGGYWIPPRFLAEYIQQNEVVRKHMLRHSALTKREQQILELVVRRLSNKEIAGILNVSERTVKFHVSNLFSKLQVHGRRNLIDEFAHAFQPA